VDIHHGNRAAVDRFDDGAAGDFDERQVVGVGHAGFLEKDGIATEFTEKRRELEEE
jgi:hypothetical protein